MVKKSVLPGHSALLNLRVNTSGLSEFRQCLILPDLTAGFAALR
jgi:hypothetical protein